MSYQVLARKWRPKNFKEMVGQEHVLKALINALDHNRLHHAYLFTGTRGVGKTTIARILARCLNCETGISSQPCGECSACVEIGEGRFVDLIEVDAASRTKVEDTRELLDNVQYAPSRGRFKIYLIDEVHMLSNHSFNALLKTLEEPPAHVKFLLATTDPQKLPVTILSRCLQFNLKNMSPERIVVYLQELLAKEVIPFEESGLWMLARSADGSMRDALSLTDQAISFGNGKIVESDVSTMLGTIDHTLIQKLIQGLIDENPANIMQVIASFAEHAPDYSAALAELLTLLHRIAIAQTVPEALDNSFGDRHQILEFARQLPPEDVQLYYQTALMGRRDLPLAADPKSGFEMTMLRMLAFKPQGVVDVPTRTLKQAPSITAESSPAEGVAGDVKKPEARPPALESRQTPVMNEAAALNYTQPAEEGAAEVNNAPVVTHSSAIDETTSAGSFQAKSSPAVASTEGVSMPGAQKAAVPETLSRGQFDVPSGAQIAENSYDDAPENSMVQECVDHAEPLQNQDSKLMPADQPVSAVPRPVPNLREKPPAPTQSVRDALREQVKAISGSEGFSSTRKANSSGSESSPIVAAATASSRTVRKPAPEGKLNLSDVNPNSWIYVYKQLGIRGILQSTAANCILVGLVHNEFNFAMDESKGTLFDTSHSMRLEGLLCDYFGEPVKVQIHLMALDGSQETPAQIIEREKAEKYAEVLLSLQQDPVVQTLENEFAASLIEETIKYS